MTWSERLVPTARRLCSLCFMWKYKRLRGTQLSSRDKFPIVFDVATRLKPIQNRQSTGNVFNLEYVAQCQRKPQIRNLTFKSGFISLLRLFFERISSITLAQSTEWDWSSKLPMKRNPPFYTRVLINWMVSKDLVRINTVCSLLFGLCNSKGNEIWVAVLPERLLPFEHDLTGYHSTQQVAITQHIYWRGKQKEVERFNFLFDHTAASYYYTLDACQRRQEMAFKFWLWNFNPMIFMLFVCSKERGH